MANLVKWTPRELFAPFEDVDNLRDEMNRVLGSFFGRNRMEPIEEGIAWYPPVDLEDFDDKYLVKAELPGMKQSDIKVTINDNTLFLSGEKKTEHKEKNADYYRYERCSGKFQRVFNLPSQVKADKIKAQYKDGVLEIEIPKAEESKPKEIEIKVT